MDEARTQRTHQSHDKMNECIARCTACHQTCLRLAMTHCLEMGGKHVEATHFRLMITCAEICQTAANLMLAGSDQHALVCKACAEICDACAKSCERLDGMESCVATCRDCAQSCRAMTAG
jgi:hypothetical protein